MGTVERTGNVFSCKDNSWGNYYFLKIRGGLSCGEDMSLVLRDPSGEVKSMYKSYREIDLEPMLVQNYLKIE